MTHALQALDIQALDNPIWHALSGPQAALATAGTLAGCYDPDVAPFAGFSQATPQAFEQLASLSGPHRTVAFFTVEPLDVTGGWQVQHTETLEQLICPAPRQREFPGSTTLVELGQADVPEMLALTAATEPGPFGPGTIRCGRYRGVRSADTNALVAMTGERLRLPSAVEISAVCTAPSHRGKGLAAVLVHAFAMSAAERGLLPFLHVRTHNAPALALYGALGFNHRRTIHLSLAISPG